MKKIIIEFCCCSCSSSSSPYHIYKVPWKSLVVIYRLRIFRADTNLLMSLNVLIIAGPLMSLNVVHSLYESSPKKKSIYWNEQLEIAFAKHVQSSPSCPSFAARMYLKKRSISGLSDVGFRSSFSSLKKT